MKVIAKTISYRVKCPSCLSIIEFQKRETKDYLHVGNLHFRGVECPVCKRAVLTSRQSSGASDDFYNSVEAVYQEEP